MAEPRVACPICPPDIECEHDQDERKILWAEKGLDPEPEPQEQFNAGDQRQVVKRKNRERAEQERADNDLRWLMAEAAGRRFVWRELARCGIYHDCISSDAATMARFLGGRNIGLQLLADVQRIAPSEYLMMLKEHADANAR